MTKRQTLWVVCGNDYPAGRAYTTEASAKAYCTEQNEAQRIARTTLSPIQQVANYDSPRIYYHYHSVEVYDEP